MVTLNGLNTTHKNVKSLHKQGNIMDSFMVKNAHQSSSQAIKSGEKDLIIFYNSRPVKQVFLSKVSYYIL